MSVVRKSSFTFRHFAQRDLFICLGTSVSAQGWELGAFIRHIPISSKITDNLRANRAACRMLCIWLILCIYNISDGLNALFNLACIFLKKIALQQVRTCYCPCCSVFWTNRGRSPLDIYIRTDQVNHLLPPRGETSIQVWMALASEREAAGMKARPLNTEHSKG